MRRILVGTLVTVGVLAGGFVWLRDSSLVQVRDVFVTGVVSSEEPQIRAALKSAALDMTTLHVREEALRAAVAAYPSIDDLDVDAQIPHKLTIEVVERAPVAALRSGGGKVAATGDGRVLRGMRSSHLPTLRVRTPPPGERVTDRRALAALGVAGGAPAELRTRMARLWFGPRGLTLDLRNGPDLVFGDAGDARRKWSAAARVLADPSSVGATYLDLRVPERVAAGGLGPIEEEESTTSPANPQPPPESGATLNP